MKMSKGQDKNNLRRKFVKILTRGQIDTAARYAGNATPHMNERDHLEALIVEVWPPYVQERLQEILREIA